MVLSLWHSHCESSFDECRLSARWPPTLRPSQPTWAVSLPVGCYHPHPPLPFTQRESWYSIYCPTEGGRMNQPAVEVCSPCPRPYITLAVKINTTACGDIQTWVHSHRSHATNRPCVIVLHMAWLSNRYGSLSHWKLYCCAAQICTKKHLQSYRYAS